MQRKTLRRVIQEPESTFRKKCFQLAKMPQFESAVLAIIVCNTLTLALKINNQSNTFELVLEIFNNLFLGLFHIEAIIKISGFGWLYFKDSWNRFDFLIIAITDVLLLFRDVATIPTVVRSLRLGRIVKFIRASKYVRIIVDTIYFLLPALANISALLILMMFIYAILGMNLFAEIKY